MVGDVVIIHDEVLPRSSWKFERVEKVLSGRDGRIQAAVVQLSTGQGTLHRPIQLLYPLEVSDDNDGATVDGPDDGTNDEARIAEEQESLLKG